MNASLDRTKRAFVFDNGSLTILPAIPEGESSVGTAISDAGHVAGFGRIPTDDWPFFVERAFIWIDGKMTHLGVLPGFDESFAIDVNSQGTVVGICEGIPNGRGFVWEKGIMTDLNDLIPDELNLLISTARGIDSAGRIVCSAYDPGIGATVGVLLTPAPAADLDCDGAVGISDLQILLDQWGTIQNSAADFNGDGSVGPADLAQLLAEWS